MPFSRVWIHYVWSTKYRKRTLHVDEFREALYEHIRENNQGDLSIGWLATLTVFIPRFCSVESSPRSTAQLVKGGIISLVQQYVGFNRKTAVAK
jgi:hypothetical protein